MRSPAKMIVIVGETASGKSQLGLLIAKKFGGEIICADSRTIYQGMDIGTAKPSRADRESVRHHLLDVVKPDQPFSVAHFKHLAMSAIDDITARDKLPIMVGGSGLYTDAVLYDYGFSKASAKRDNQNPRHLNLEVPRLKKELRQNSLIIGLSIPKAALQTNIQRRVEQMVKAGFIDEVKSMISKYPESKALLAPGYKAFRDYINNDISLEEAKSRFVLNDLRLAKRQRTWFRRNKSIQWFDNRDKIVEAVTTFLNK